MKKGSPLLPCENLDTENTATLIVPIGIPVFYK